jgi:transcriptional regulator with XRE-family HTH domain
MATAHLVQTANGWPHRTDHEDGRTGFGEWLRRTREARGLSLDDISHETKIPLRNLKALELGHLGVQPTFYQRAVVRAVAKAVGVDERLALERLDAAIAPVVTPPTAEVARPRMKATVPASFGVLALGALLLAGALTRPANESLDATASRPEPATVAPRPPVGQSASVAAAVSVEASPVVATEAVAAPPASFTELVVRTEPPGALVTVNGVGWGASPVTIRHLAPGEKRIRATKEGFGAAERVVALDGDQRRTLDLQLTAVP